MKPSSVFHTLNHLLDIQRAGFLWGPPGVGKSDVVAQVARHRDIELRDVRLSLLDPVDLKGFPVPNTTKRVMDWLPASFLPSNAKSKGILFLDEMNSAPPSVQAAAYQLVLNRRIGDYELPKGWGIVAAGNRESDRSVTHRMPAALANRLIHIDFDVHLDDFCAWAIPAGIKTEVLAFLRFRTNLLHNFDGMQRAFPTPRSWMFVNDIIQSKLPSDEEFELIKGTVGEGAAGEFVAFQRVMRDLPSIDDIMLRPSEIAVPKEPSVLYALTTSLATRAMPDNFDRLMKYVDRIPTEFQVVFVRDAARRNKDVYRCKSFTQFAVKNSDVLM